MAESNSILLPSPLIASQNGHGIRGGEWKKPHFKTRLPCLGICMFIPLCVDILAPFPRSRIFLHSVVRTTGAATAAVAKADAEGAAKAEATMRSPIICVMGHVDVGKTKILDKIRCSSVQKGEAGGITQQIGATLLPIEEIEKQTSELTAVQPVTWKIPGLLVLDTPGHEAFNNLRDIGASLCNIAVLVVDIMHGVEDQTRESIEMLQRKKCPFVIALNKVDRLHGWKATPNGVIQTTLKEQQEQTIDEFEKLAEQAMHQILELGFMSQLYYKLSVKDSRNHICIVPTSAHTGEGVPDLLFTLCRLSQTLLTRHITCTGKLKCTVLEVKKTEGVGTSIDVILSDGELHEGDRIILAGMRGPIDTIIKGLYMPEPLEEIRIKSAFRRFKTLSAANGIRIAAKELEETLTGLQLYVAANDTHAEELKTHVQESLHQTIQDMGMDTVTSGVYVVSSTLGSMRALVKFLKDMKIPVSKLSIGKVTLSDLQHCATQFERDPRFAVCLAFDVDVDKTAKSYAAQWGQGGASMKLVKAGAGADAYKLSKEFGIKIFTAKIIYHLFDAWKAHEEGELQRSKLKYGRIAVLPCRLQILSDCIFSLKDPIVIGVKVKAGIVKLGTPITVPSKNFLDLGHIVGLQQNKEDVDRAHAGDEVAIKIEPAAQEGIFNIANARKARYGVDYDDSDEIVSRISEESIDAVKAYFKDEMTKADWRLMIELKKLFNIRQYAAS